MRLRLPATQERDDMILKATHAATGAAPEDDYEGKQAVRVAQTTVQSLQVAQCLQYNTIVLLFSL